jgi:tripeptide aminopeptidase
MSTPEQELLSLFLRLAPIEGVSHAERAIADEVTAILRRAGIRVVEDGAAGVVKGNTGNLLCFPPSFDEHAPATLLEAHLDTVQSTASLKAIVKEDRVTSDGSTILGADNRMGLSLLVDLLLKVAKPNEAHRNFFVALTVCEETGLYGADAIDLSVHNVTEAFVFDCSKRPGIYIRESVGLYAFTAQFLGKAAHAGVAPEEGISAIALSAAAISKIRLGRIDADTTANIGKIYGGEAVNVVPDKVTIEGEVRSFFPERIREQIDHIRRTFEGTVGDAGRVQFNAAPDFEPYVHKPDSPTVRHLESAIHAAGLIPQPIRYMGGSDANKYNAKGIPAVNIGIGAQKPHSVEEFFLLEDLYKSSRIAYELIQIHQ